MAYPDGVPVSEAYPSGLTAAELDARDPLAAFRNEFLVAEAEEIYMDGNSLGRLPHRAAEAIRRAVHDDWGRGLIRSWDHWWGVAEDVGDRVASSVLGARPGEVIASDSTSVNLYKLAVAAMGHDRGRSTIVTDAANFPTDRYVLDGVARDHGGRLVEIDSGPLEEPTVASLETVLDDDVALVSFSHVAYRTGAAADIAAITAAAHEAGALVLWDLSHSVASVPADLAATGVDMAVGCSYKYLNGGPGSPAFLHVRSGLVDSLQQPVHGWYGQQDLFEMGPTYDPRPDIGRFLVGTPPMIQLLGLSAALEVVEEAGMDRLRAKGMALTSRLVDLADEHLADLGFTVASPRAAERRGSHVALRHRDAESICARLMDEYSVIGDFRTPDVIRLAPAPLYTRFVDVDEAVDRLAAASR
ncbi:MAG: kynureninase [Acidimicrobiales bacterium]